jgi:hypothetical protein
MVDYYQILELPLNASDSEIQHAYRQLIQVWHPDRFQGNPGLLKRAEQKTKQINEAFLNLRDPELRTQHDDRLKRYYAEQSQPTPSHPDPSPRYQAAQIKIVPCPNPRCGVGLRVPAKGRLKISCPQCDSHFMYDPSLDATWNVHTVEDPKDAKHDNSSASKSAERAHWDYRLGEYLGRTYAEKAPAAIKVMLRRPIVWVVMVIGLLGILNSERILQPPTASDTSRSSPLPRGVMVPNAPSERMSKPPVSSQIVAMPESLPTGTCIGQCRIPKGRGSLKVINGTNLDAVVKLGEYGKRGRFLGSLYIKANEELNLKNVGSGNFRLAFALGMDWNQGSRHFNEPSHYRVFDEPIRYAETKEVQEIETENGIETRTKISAAEWTFTLHPVPTGNALTTSIDEGVFDRLFLDNS